MSARRSLVVTTLPVLLVLGLVVITPVQAGIYAPDDDDPAAMALLNRAVLASSTLAYTGTQFVSTWTALGSVTRVLAVRQGADGRRWVSVREAGHAGERSAEWQVAASAAASSSAADPLDLLAGTYSLALGSHDAVAGRPSAVIMARRAGALVARLWVDERTGLLLREEVFDAAGRLTRLCVFVQLSVTGSAGDSRARVVAVDRGSAAGVGRGLSADELQQLVRKGWVCPTTLPGGFRLIDARRSSAGGGAVVHLTYTDGLSGLSLFVQRGRAPETVTGTRVQQWDGAAVHVGTGWPIRVVWQGGGNVIVAVADSPLDEVRAVVRALPHDGEDGSGVGGALTRLERGARSAVEMLVGH